MAEKIAVNSAPRLSEAIKKITDAYRTHKHVVITLRPGKDRTLDQNALWFALYQRISQMTQIGDVDEARKYCKLHMGIQILLNEDEDFRTAWHRTTRHLAYEEKLNLMGNNPLFGPDGFPVTRLFNRAQGIAYTNRIVDHFVAQGVVFDDLLNQEAA